MQYSQGPYINWFNNMQLPNQYYSPYMNPAVIQMPIPVPIPVPTIPLIHRYDYSDRNMHFPVSIPIDDDFFDDDSSDDDFDVNLFSIETSGQDADTKYQSRTLNNQHVHHKFDKQAMAKKVGKTVLKGVGKAAVHLAISTITHGLFSGS